MDRETAKDIVKGYLDDYLRGRGINTRKPFNCLNPKHPDKHPSMSYDKNRQRVKCFSCGASYDIFDLIGFEYGLSEDKDKFNKAYELYNITIDKDEKKAPDKQKKERSVNKPLSADKIEYYEKAKNAFKGSPAEEYLKGRGISEEVAAKFWAGYDAEHKVREENEDGQLVWASWRVLIIPTGKNSFIARNIDKPKAPEKKNRYRKKGASVIFNSKALYSATQPIFVVEGELDALSIIEAGGQAVALGSTSNSHQLVNMCSTKKPVQTLILSLDLDEEGRKTEDNLAEELTKFQIPFYRYNISGAAKDANEALTTNREAFIDQVKEAEQAERAQLEAQAEATREAYLQTSAAASIPNFLNGITASVNTPALSTGFSNLDEILDGGLYEGLYIMGAISSLGKTTLALQLADNLAQGGQDVLIFSLEMAKSELMAKSISRLTFLKAKNKAHAKTVRGITAGARYANYNQEEKALINQAISQYKEYAQHIFIHEGIGDIGVEQVRDIVEQHENITGNKPVVIIDYLQILAPYNMAASDKQNTDKSVLELKRLSRDLKITVFGISSFNRDSYKTSGGNYGKVSMVDFKESGAIEYSADVLIGLEFTAAGDKNYSERDEKRENPRHIRLVVMKNRNGKAWEKTNFEYYPLFNYYAEV